MTAMIASRAIWLPKLDETVVAPCAVAPTLVARSAWSAASAAARLSAFVRIWKPW